MTRQQTRQLGDLKFFWAPLASMFVSFVVGKETNHGAARALMPYQHASNWRAQERTLYGENRP
jgi:hypothetical protein